MTPGRRPFTLALAVALVAHAGVVFWVAGLVAPAPEPGGYSVLRVQLGAVEAAAAPAVPPPFEAAPLPPPPEPPPPEPPPPPPPPRPAARKVAEEPRPPKPSPPPRPTPPQPAPPQPVPAEPAPEPAAHPAAAAPAGAAAGAPGPAAPTDVVESAGPPELPPAYVHQVRGWLERHRTYPLAARRQRIEGRAVLWFRIDRQGRVLAYRIEESSGHGLLDRAVEQMIERASPLPRVPSSYPLDEPEFLIPIDFRLR